MRTPMKLLAGASVLAVLAGVAIAQQEPEQPGGEYAAPLTADWQERILSVRVGQGAEAEALEIHYAVVEGLAVFEGDIVLGSELDVALLNLATVPPADAPDDPATIGIRGLAVKAGFGGVARRWAGKTVPYVLPADLPNPARVTEAILHWEDKTDIDFVPRTNEADFVTFRTSTDPGSCSSSSVGRAGGQQFVTLGANCPRGSIIHELGHVVGLGHEHTRNDRNQHVLVDFSNLKQQFWSQYKQNPGKYADTGPYDFGSIMHYPDRGRFNVDPNRPSIVALQGSPRMGQRAGLSPGDISTVATMYAGMN